MTSRFRITCHFETSAPNDPQMTLNTTRGRTICVTSVPVPDSACLALRPALFELQESVRCVHRMTSKLPRTVQRQRYIIYALLVCLSPKFHSRDMNKHLTNRFSRLTCAFKLIQNV